MARQYDHCCLVKPCLVAALVGSMATSEAIANESVRIEWGVPRDLVAEVRDELHLDGTITGDKTTASDSKGLPLIYIFAGFVSLPSLVSAIRTAIRDVTCGGVVVEETGGELAIRCEPSLGVGTVVIRDAQGTRIERFEEVREPGPLLDSLTRLGSGT
jgi:hypothetical protein